MAKGRGGDRGRERKGRSVKKRERELERVRQTRERKGKSNVKIFKEGIVKKNKKRISEREGVRKKE